MENKFAKKTHLVKSSETREILKATERQEIISFAGGPAMQGLTETEVPLLMKNAALR